MSIVGPFLDRLANAMEEGLSYVWRPEDLAVDGEPGGVQLGRAPPRRHLHHRYSLTTLRLGRLPPELLDFTVQHIQKPAQHRFPVGAQPIVLVLVGDPYAHPTDRRGCLL